MDGNWLTLDTRIFDHFFPELYNGISMMFSHRKLPPWEVVQEVEK